ncbi:MAG: 3-oxoacyl-[acyl-carrier-protein] reductase [Pseudomonadota bacterium]|jgi:NAD(P)-dependent dehydrogenase (short-subunit alcohol dehydrogenase family)
MDLELEGKRAIVTGGSRGIGKVIAWQLASEGVDVVIAARGEEMLRVAAKEIAAETGRRIIPVVVDTSNRASVDNLIKTALSELGGLDILVNNAALPGGISTATKVEQVVDEEALEDININ